MAVKSHSCPSWRIKRLRLFGQLGFLDSGNVDIVAVEESQKCSYFYAYSVRVPLHQTLVGVGVETGPGVIWISPAH